MGDLTSLANAKTWCGVTGAADDALLTRLLSAVSAAAQNRMQRIIASASYAIVRNGTGKSKMPFPDQPVTAVTSVRVDGTLIPARTSVTGSGYSFDDMLLYLDGYAFTKGNQNVALQYTAGFLTTPTDLEQAVLEIIAHKYKEKDRIGQASKILAGETVSFFRDVPPDTLRVLDNYMRVTAS